MFREMRRNRQALSLEECQSILQKATSGVLALAGDGGYPYAVPLSYHYAGGKLYFHGALEGHKIDAVRRCDKASFCVVDQDQVRPEEYTTYYRSVICFGRIRLMDDPGEIRAAIEALATRYHPEDSAAHRDQAIDRELPGMAMLELTVEHMTGKQAAELARKGS